MIIKVPHKTKIHLNNSVDWLMIQRKENTSHYDTSFVLAFISYQLSLLLIWSSCLAHSHIHTGGALKVGLCTILLKVIYRNKKYSSCSIIILFASINSIVTLIKILFYLNKSFLTFVKYFEHFSGLFSHQFLTKK